MITGSTYVERGQPVTALTAWNGKRADLPAPLPLVTTAPSAPRNVLIQRADGTRVIRPFRGLRRT
jgi:acetyl esterase